MSREERERERERGGKREGERGLEEGGGMGGGKGGRTELGSEKWKARRIWDRMRERRGA